MRQPNPERGLFMDIQKKQFMNIYGSLMDIFDEKNKDIYNGTMLHAPAQPLMR